MDSSNPGQRRFIAASDAPPMSEHGVATRYMRLQNALVAWSEVLAASATLRQDASAEIFVILPDTGAVLSGNGAKAEASARSISILPAGPTTIHLTSPGRVIRIFSPVPEALAAHAINGADYAARGAGTTPIGAPLAYAGGAGVRIYEIDRFKAAAGKRPPSFQTAMMNIMWIEQDGPHNPAKLNPHAHDDFEEGALVVDGEYVQHLRTPWTIDAGQWRDDEHVTCKPGTLMIVPPTVIHTTGALGTGRHLMANVFAPARADHIQSGMVLNAKEYVPG